MINREIVRILNPKASQGFLGEGHTAIPVIGGNNFEQTDPFILLMDDQLNLPGNDTVGGEHPHAGFEIVTLVLEGDDNSKSKSLQTGGLEWLTAGGGIVHFEEIKAKVKLRILQLWLVLPKAKRWAEPKWQELRLENVPVKKDGNSEIRVYSGTSVGLTSPTQNETPTIIVDFNLEADYEVVQEIPASYNCFIYVIKGTIEVGEGKTEIGELQVAWMDKPNEKVNSQIKVRGGKTGGRFILYAGETQGVPIVSQGPFIADTKEDIVRLYHEYKKGKMMHVNHLPEKQVVHHV